MHILSEKISLCANYLNDNQNQNESVTHVIYIMLVLVGWFTTKQKSLNLSQIWSDWRDKDTYGIGGTCPSWL